MNHDKRIFIFDFDSTFVQGETLEILAEVALKTHSDKATLQATIKALTNKAMEGTLSFAESLKERMALIPLNADIIQETIRLLQDKITPSIARNKDFFIKNAGSIYIVSGGFTEIILPIVHAFGIARDHILANRFLYDFEGHILGYDQNQFLAHDEGKVKAIQQLQLGPECIIVGDGYTDYEVKAAGVANTFVAFTENIAREKVVSVADIVVHELEGLFLSCALPFSPGQKPKKALLLENLHPCVIHYFKNLGYELECLPNALDEESLIQKMQNVEVLGIRSKTEVTAKVIQSAPHLETIGAFCIGTNQIDLMQCSQKGIAVFNAPYSNTRSVVELAIAEMIMLLRRATQMSHLLHQGEWCKSATGAHEVRGKTLGIVGYGHIGAQLSILAEAFGMRVLFYDIEDKLALGNAKPCTSLQACLKESDVVSIHVDGRPSNKHLISHTQFEWMKPGVVFLNLSRGSIVDFEALLNFVRSGKIVGVGIDVFPEEPHDSRSPFHTELQQFDNVILTPHIGGSTQEAQKNIGDYVSKNLHAYVKDGTTMSSVNFPALYLPTLDNRHRIIHIHQNVPGVLAQINSLFAEHGINIEGQFLKTNDQMGYVITDINHSIEDSVLKDLQNIKHTIKVKILNN